MDFYLVIKSPRIQQLLAISLPFKNYGFLIHSGLIKTILKVNSMEVKINDNNEIVYQAYNTFPKRKSIPPLITLS